MRHHVILGAGPAGVIAAETLRKHAPDFDPATLEMRTSSAGNYLSVTATVNATSREQLDELYRELCAHPMVARVL